MHLLAFMLGAVVLSAETSSPALNLFTRSDRPTVTLKATGLDAASEQPLVVSIYDATYANEIACIRRRVHPAADGSWQETFKLPHDRLGVFIVRPTLGGATLPKRGTMPQGAFTYGVVPDPAKRPIPAEDAFLGLHGDAGVDLRPFLHARGGFGDARRPSFEYYQVSNYKIHDCMKDFWKRILADEKAQDELERYLDTIVKAAVAAGHGLQQRRVYETCWEPELSAPSPEAVVKACEIAWKTIHRLDPEALVAAPTLCNAGSVAYLRRLLDAGLAQWMNAYSVHPYVQPCPEANGFLENLRIVKRLLNDAKGREIPMIATEGGFNLTNSPWDEREKLGSQVRESLIMLGEGFLWSMPFYAYDFGADAGDQLEGDYGLCYNALYPAQRWSPGIVFPRPVFAGLAAFGALTEGLRPSCTIEWLGESVLGYAYTSKDDARTVLALWDWSGRPSSVEIPVGVSEVKVADEMGNVRLAKAPNGKLALELTDLPQYVLGASPKVWGFAAQKKLKWSASKFKSAELLAPVAIEEVVPRFAGASPGVAVTLRNRTGGRLSAEVKTRIPGHPDARRAKSVSLRPDGSAVVVIPFDRFAPDPLARLSLETTVVPEAGTAVRRTDALNFLTAPSEFRMADGGRVRLSWTPARLGLEIDVPDNTQTNGWTGWHTWKGDSVQIGLARTALAKRSENDLADAAEQAMGEYTLALTPNGPEVYRTISWNEKLFPSDISGGGLVPKSVAPLTVERKPGLCRYRVAFPWSFINREKMADGDTFRLAIQVNDWDFDGKRAERKLFDLMLSPPRHFGLVTLRKE